jgi:hypothetical protein
MSESRNDTGTIQVLLERLNKFLLPRALAVKTRVDAGEKLTDADIEFLKQVLADARQVEPLAATHPEYQSLTGQVVNLYDEITRKALENEQEPH